MTDAPEQGASDAPCRPDWRLAAALLAFGQPLVQVARDVGCSRSQLSRRRNHDPMFQSWIEEFREAEYDPRDPMTRLRVAVHLAIEKAVRKDNIRVVLWLADRLKLVTPPSERTPGQELKEILSSLSPEELQEFESLRDPA